MAIGSGAGAYFGVSAESTWGTYVAPTRFLPGSFTVKPEHQVQSVGGYAAAGRLAPVDEIETPLMIALRVPSLVIWVVLPEVKSL